MSTRNSWQLAEWFICLSLVCLLLLVSGMWVLSIQLAYCVLAFATHLTAGWLWRGFGMLREGPIIWPVAAAFCLAMTAWLLARTRQARLSEDRQADDNEGESVDSDTLATGHRVRRLSLTLALLASLLAGADLAQNLTAFFTQPIFNSGGHRVARQRTQSMNNLKGFGLALHNYHDTRGVFPPGATAAVLDGEHPGLETRHGWATLLLPYLDEKPLFQQIDFDVAWDDSKNDAAMRTQIPYFLNPALSPPDSRYRRSISTYGVIHFAGNDRLFGVNNRTRLRDITDGGSNTMFAGEVSANWRAWGQPGNWRDARLGISKSPNGFGSPFPHGTAFLRVDGSVKIINESIDPSVLQNFANPRDGNSLPAGF